MRWYRLLARLLPRSFRNEYADDLEALAASMADAARHERWTVRARLRAGLAADAVRQSVALRRSSVDTRHRTRGWLVDRLRQDLGQARRALVARPGFTVAVVGLMALGIGANAAIFGVVDATLLRPLPYRDPARLVLLWERYEPIHLDTMPWSLEDYRDLAARQTQFAGTAIFRNQRFVLTGDGDPVRLSAEKVAPSLFSVLGVRAERGRLFTADDGREGHDHVVVLTDHAWRARFGGDPAIVGRAIVLDGANYQVVGVLPPGVSFPPPVTFGGQMLTMEPDMFVPFVVGTSGARGNHRHFVIARLADGATTASAAGELASIAAGIAREHPDTNDGIEMFPTPLHGQSVVTIRTVLFLLLVAVAAVLLVACASVANLLLARGTARTREMALRAALGAGRGRLVWQLLFESVVLGTIGGAAGLVVAHFCALGLMALNPIELPAMYAVRLDTRVFLFATGATGLAVLGFGLLPALQASRVDLVAALRSGGRGASAPSLLRMKSALVVGQIALALVLLTGAGLTVRSLARLWSVDPGFTPEGVAAVPISLPPTMYGDAGSQRLFQSRLIERAGALPGVSHAALVTILPFTFDRNASDYNIEGQPPQPPGHEFIATFQRISPDYFSVLRVPIVTGRAFRDADGPDAPLVVIVNEALARRHWPDGSAVGHRLMLDDMGPEHQVRTIVGVVRDVRMNGFDSEIEPMIYEPLAELPSPAYWLALRSARDAAGLSTDVRGAVRALDPALPVAAVQSMSELMGETVKKPRFAAVVLSAFGLAALVIAAAGLYGVLAFDVVQRLRDFAIRIALGASSHDVRQIVLGRSLRLVAIGVGIGLAGSMAMSRVVSGLLFGVSATDGLTFASAGVILAIAAGLAAWLPARRATRTDPITALRAE